MQQPIIQVSNLKIGYRNTLCPEITMSANRGELIAIIGSNGIGKSTLIKTLCAIIAPLSGEIIIRGHSIKNKAMHHLASEASLVLTEPISSKGLKVSEVVALSRHSYTSWQGKLGENDKKHIEKALLQTETIELQDKRCYEISDGQLQRVMIARALAQDTPLILLDEPTSYLDIYHRIAIFKLLKSLTRDSNKSIIISSHEIELCLHLADRILLLHPKEVIFGTPQEIICSSAFTDLFPKDTIRFNHKKMRFEVKDI